MTIELIISYAISCVSYSVNWRAFDYEFYFSCSGDFFFFFHTVFSFYSREWDWDYMSFRFWIGTWIAIILLVLVAIDASALVCYITRFTEENFATLIAFIFIYKVSISGSSYFIFLTNSD